ncbi:MAG TPA: hypothetical protein VNH84_07500, partial [Candidatus Saccharimonadales bacterium]|nr:hypothetical protein [Candidatus Saccharimonadales bacterium]
CGVDPTMGILGWTRQLATDEDEKHDNAAIEVFRRGLWRDIEQEVKDTDGKLVKRKIPTKQPDVQVAEWVGPLDAEDLAYVCNFVGRMYAGNSEEQQALMAIEIAPGPGWLTQRVLNSQYGYERFPPWLVEGSNLVQRDTGKRGWISNVHTRRDLWIRGAGHLNRQKAILNSKHLVEEMVACKPDNFLALTARAQRSGTTGLNDDRVVASLIALWFCNEWQIGQEPTEPAPRTDVATPDWQLSAVSAEDLQQLWDDRVSDLMS